MIEPSNMDWRNSTMSRKIYDGEKLKPYSGLEEKCPAFS
jgi:hypothetical protein